MGELKCLCLYCNRTERVIILRCLGPDSFFLEKAVFPWEEWVFSCPPSSRVEIWTHGLMGAELRDCYSARELGQPEDIPSAPR